MPFQTLPGLVYDWTEAGQQANAAIFCTDFAACSKGLLAFEYKFKDLGSLDRNRQLICGQARSVVRELVWILPKARLETCMLKTA